MRRSRSKRAHRTISETIKARGFRNQTAIVAQANDDYAACKAEAIRDGIGLRVTIAIIEKRWKLKPGQLLYFRANLPRKKTPIPDLVDSL